MKRQPQRQRPRRRQLGSPPATRWMGGEDSGLLALDLPDQPMSILFMIVLRHDKSVSQTSRETVMFEGHFRGDLDPRLSLADLRARVEKRLDYMPALRWRMMPVPGGIHHPLWVDDPDFDVARHLSHVRIPPPGEFAQLSEAYARLVARPIDRSRPLWDLTLFDGLADGRQAIAWRFHHCLMDGGAGLTVLDRFFAEDDALTAIEATEFRPGDPPTRRQLVRLALTTQRQHHLPTLVRRTRQALKAREQFRVQSPVSLPRAPGDVPPTPITNAFGPRRSFASLQFDLSELRLIREASGASYTDVALAIVAGALRARLLEAGQLPGRPLVAECPISLEPADAPVRLWGNRFTNVLTTLATDVDDPWERLARISEVTAAARDGFEAIGADLWNDWLEALPPILSTTTMRRHYRHRRAHPETANANVVMTSVRGPSKPWRLGPFVAEEVWGAGPPANGVGSLFAFISYAGRVFVGINTVEGSLGDGRHLVESARRAIDELLREAEARRAI